MAFKRQYAGHRSNLHLPYAVRSRPKPKVMGNLTADNLMGVEWRFLHEVSRVRALHGCCIGVR